MITNVCLLVWFSTFVFPFQPTLYLLSKSLLNNFDPSRLFLSISNVLNNKAKVFWPPPTWTAGSLYSWYTIAILWTSRPSACEFLWLLYLHPLLPGSLPPFSLIYSFVLVDSSSRSFLGKDLKSDLEGLSIAKIFYCTLKLHW